MKKETLFSNEIFNDKIYNDTKRKFEQMADTLPDLLASISAEGLPADWGFIESITHTKGHSESGLISRGKSDKKASF